MQDLCSRRIHILEGGVKFCENRVWEESQEVECFWGGTEPRKSPDDAHSLC